jgi:phage-related protein
MRLKIWIDGVDIWTLGFRVLRLPPLQVPELIVDDVVIPGRPEYLTDSRDQFHNLPKTVELAYIGDDVMTAIQPLVAAQNVRFSNEEDFVYICDNRSGQKISRLIADWHKFNFTWICKPLKRKKTPAKLTGLTWTGTNQGTWPSEPKFVINVGSSTKDIVLTVAGQTVELKQVKNTVTLDSESRTVKQGTVNIDSKMWGDFPVLPLGSVSIACTGAVSMETYPNWRWR